MCHIGLVHCNSCRCKFKGFHIVFFISGKFKGVFKRVATTSLGGVDKALMFRFIITGLPIYFEGVF